MAGLNEFSDGKRLSGVRLRKREIKKKKKLSLMVKTYFMVSYHDIQINQCRVGWLIIVISIDVWCIAVVVGVPGEKGGRHRGIIDPGGHGRICCRPLVQNL